jgi:hypothetical protein
LDIPLTGGLSISAETAGGQLIFFLQFSNILTLTLYEYLALCSGQFNDVFSGQIKILPNLFYELINILTCKISMLLADKCHAQVPEQQRDTLDERNAQMILLAAGGDKASRPINALIGSAVRVMPKKRGGEDNKKHSSRMRGSENGVGWQQKLRNRWKAAGKDHEQQQNLEEKRPIQTDALLNSVEIQKPPKGNE